MRPFSGYTRWKKHSRDHINHIRIPVFRIYHISAISRTSENRQHILDHTQNTDQQKSIGSARHETKQFIQSFYNIVYSNIIITSYYYTINQCKYQAFFSVYRKKLAFFQKLLIFLAFSEKIYVFFSIFDI